MRAVKDDLRDTLLAYRKRMGAGRAIAAPQIGVFKRAIYLHIGTPTLLLNPVLTFPNAVKMEVLDDCMSFPHLYVRLTRYRDCVLDYMDENWEPQRMELSGDLSELIQHEYDHLDGILATRRGDGVKALVMAEH